MKSPIDKAKQLVNRFYGFVLYEDEQTVFNGQVLPIPSKKANAKRCAIETVDEITMAIVEATGDELGGPHLVYWASVRNEIEEM